MKTLVLVSVGVLSSVSSFADPAHFACRTAIHFKEEGANARSVVYSRSHQARFYSLKNADGKIISEVKGVVSGTTIRFIAQINENDIFSLETIRGKKIIGDLSESQGKESLSERPAATIEKLTRKEVQSLKSRYLSKNQSLTSVAIECGDEAEFYPSR